MYFFLNLGTESMSNKGLDNYKDRINNYENS